jgi:hypothetical protein
MTEHYCSEGTAVYEPLENLCPPLYQGWPCLRRLALVLSLSVREAFV